MQNFPPRGSPEFPPEFSPEFFPEFFLVTKLPKSIQKRIPGKIPGNIPGFVSGVVAPLARRKILQCFRPSPDVKFCTVFAPHQSKNSATEIKKIEEEKGGNFSGDEL